MLSDEQIRDALRALESGLDLDPPQDVIAALAAAGHHKAMIEHHHWLLVAKAQQACSKVQGDAIDEKFREYVLAGYEGLERAAQAFEAERGYRFGTWASWYITEAIASYVASRAAPSSGGSR